MIDMRAATVVAPHGRPDATIRDVQATSTPLTAEQPGQQRLALARGPARHAAVHIGIIGDLALDGVILVPRDVALMVILQ